jgi:hypothetical protein
MSEIGTLLDRLGEQATVCRSLIREMHELQRSLRDEAKEARALMAAMRECVSETAHAEVARSVEAAIRLQLDELGKETHKAMRTTTRKIFAEFDSLVNPLYGVLGMMELIANNEARRRKEAEEDGDESGD